MPATMQSAVYTAVYDRLASDALLCSLLPAGADSISAHPQADTALPYVALGGSTQRAVPATDGAAGSVSMAIDVYSNQPGGREARALLAAVQDALMPALTISGYRRVVQDVGEASSGPLTDGKTYRARCSVTLTCVAEDV